MGAASSGGIAAAGGLAAPPGRSTVVGQVRRLIRPPSARVTNLTLLISLVLVFATGLGGVSTGTARGRWIVIGHGCAAVIVTLMIPWKTRVVRYGLRRFRHSRWLSLVLVGLAAVALLAGFGYATGLVRSVAGVPGMWLHIAAALALVPLLLWHILARRTRARRSDLSRRSLLRDGALLTAGAAGYLLLDSAVRRTGLPGSARRFTGSYEEGSFRPEAMPNTSWLDDPVPAMTADSWRLEVIGPTDRYQVGLAQLAIAGTRLRATLDCTSGWYAEQDWVGVPVRSLLSHVGASRSLLVHSVTGYQIRFPVAEFDRLLLATMVGDAPLSAGHGFPLRLVAPGRRGFWWVKWVDRIELQDAPSWWQPPFPVT
jgi:Oxidoreductase molybdopterin binding domain